jgi:hypothetical protein
MSPFLSSHCCRRSHPYPPIVLYVRFLTQSCYSLTYPSLTPSITMDHHRDSCKPVFEPYVL